MFHLIIRISIDRMEEAERMERRERDKRERAKMSLTQNQEPEPEMPCLFSGPIRVNLKQIIAFIFFYIFSNEIFMLLPFLMKRTSPTEKDRQIQSSLGDFQCLKQLIERDTTHGSRLVGVSSSQIRSQPNFPLSSILQNQAHKIQISSQVYPTQTRNHSKPVNNFN